MIVEIIQIVGLVTTVIKSPLSQYVYKKYNIRKNNKKTAKEYHDLQLNTNVSELNEEEYDMLESVMFEIDTNHNKIYNR